MVDKLSLSNMGANISKVWDDNDSLLSADDVEKAVQEGIEMKMEVLGMTCNVIVNLNSVYILF